MWDDHDTTYLIDTKKYSDAFSDIESKFLAFEHELNEVDIVLSQRSSIKEIYATTYVVGRHVGNWFNGLAQLYNFCYNEGRYYPKNDLIGYYKGIPVLQHPDIDDNDGFAIYKSADGQIAPVMRGIYLPLTNVPEVGDLNGTEQFKRGVYFQDTYYPLKPELIQKFSINS